jgi:hypothetical protein
VNRKSRNIGNIVRMWLFLGSVVSQIKIAFAAAGKQVLIGKKFLEAVPKVPGLSIPILVGSLFRADQNKLTLRGVWRDKSKD